MRVTDRVATFLDQFPDATNEEIAVGLGLEQNLVRALASRIRRRRGALSPTVRREIRMENLAAALEARREDEAVEAEEIRETILGLSRQPLDPPEWIVSRSPRTGEKVCNIPVTNWSDWHLGEVVSAAELNGVNEFNLEVAERRIRKLVGKTISLCFDHMTETNYTGVIVCLGGDIVSGEIHEELTNTNEQTTLQTVLWAIERITWAIKTMADHFGRVFVPCVSGNHGRTTRKVDAKRFIHKNFDWLIYNLCEKYFRDIGDERVQFYIPASNEAMFRIYGHRFLLIHGHDLGVRGGDGIIGALGPLRRGRIKVGAQQASIGLDFDTLIVGHWHQYIPMRDLIVNNSLKGYDEFARSFLRAPVTPPSQALWFVHPDHGITSHWEVFVDGPVVGQKPNKPERDSWVAWRK